MKNISNLFLFLLSFNTLFSQNKIVKYTDKQGWEQQILHYLTPKGKEYARVYLSLNKENKSRDSLAFYKTGIRQYFSNGKTYEQVAQIDYDDPNKLKGEYIILQHIYSIDNWENLFYDNTFIHHILKEKK
ncbi:MAG: hypothetical protein Q3983_04070 [Capnocytophaga sp.]|nr:hypothetical protein [Capnocytophaga sp.]